MKAIRSVLTPDLRLRN